MENCVQKLYNPAERDTYEYLGSGCSRKVFDMGDNLVIKFLYGHCFFTNKELFDKPYSHENIDELIARMLADKSLNYYDGTTILNKINQVFAEWKLWEEVEDDEREFLAPIVEIGFDENMLPYTIMEKADGIIEQLIYETDYKPIFRVDATCDGEYTCPFSQVKTENCAKCEHLIKSHDETDDDICEEECIQDFLKTERYSFDFEKFYRFADKYNLSDVLCNTGNIGIFNGQMKIVDYGFVDNARTYQKKYEERSGLYV